MTQKKGESGTDYPRSSAPTPILLSSLPQLFSPEPSLDGRGFGNGTDEGTYEIQATPLYAPPSGDPMENPPLGRIGSLGALGQWQGRLQEFLGPLPF